MTLVLSLRPWLCNPLSRLLLVLLVGWVLSMPVRALADPLVVVVSSERTPAYAEAAEALISELEQNGLTRGDILDLSSADFPTQGGPNPRLFIALGQRAATQLMAREGRTPLLCTLLPRHSFERLLQQSGRKTSGSLSALYLDQPAARQLELIRLALPQSKRVGLVWGPDSQVQTFELLAAMPPRSLRGISPNVAPGEPVYPALKKVLDEADVLLAVPDPQIYNSNTIQNLLLATYRANVPMVAFSPAYVKAGPSHCWRFCCRPCFWWRA
jgi:putative ABC transport system substrate-binding protein